MFETHESAKLEVPTGLADPSEYAWGFVYSRIDLHWLHVVARSRYEEDGYNEHRNFYLIQVDDLKAINESPDWEIKEVSLVSPGHMNKSGHWQMDLLEEILIGRESKLNHEQYGYVFILSNGQRYIRSCHNSENELIDMDSIYRAKKTQQPPS